MGKLRCLFKILRRLPCRNIGQASSLPLFEVTLRIHLGRLEACPTLPIGKSFRRRYVDRANGFIEWLDL